jgi:hypothetical protein
MNAATGRCGVSGVGPDQVIPELEEAWGPAGYHAFGVDVAGKQWSAISSAGDVLAADTPGALTVKIRAHWQAMQ